MKTQILLLTMLISQTTAAQLIPSPDGKLVVEFHLDNGSPGYSVRLNNQVILGDSKLGLVLDDEDFSTQMKLVNFSKLESFHTEYRILTAKRRVNHYNANLQVVRLQSARGTPMNINFIVSDDGIGFSYHFPNESPARHTVKDEVTSFRLPVQAKAWVQPMSVAKSGYERTNPAYEEFYTQGVPAREAVSLGSGWVFPALFNVNDTWVLLSETGPGRRNCGSHLIRREGPGAEYAIALADPRETMPDGHADQQFAGPWSSAERLIVVGSLKTIAESTLGIDLADTQYTDVDLDLSKVKPGKASWSWPLLGDRQTTYDVQKRFIDFAADMNWEYCLIDALWDTQIGYDKIKELADYAATKNVGLLLWYNSAGAWNTTKQTPRDKMLTHESRIAEFDKLKAMGIKGVKVDFFGGDGQSVIRYYHDILVDSAPYGLLMNFHGATLPRGWARTYPHLMTMEAVRGFEYITFAQENADQEPTHAATIPFTRNVFDPMDFTPVCLDRINDRVTRKTTAAFELALSVLFTSGIQHYPETPEGMAKMPSFVKEFMKHVPSVWDDTKFIDGYPGKLVVMARQGNKRWYVAGINGEPVEKDLNLDLSRLPPGAKGLLITDGSGTELFESHPVTLDANGMLSVKLKPAGGFVLTLE